MKIIGVYNIKGGVGKTATAVNLGYLSAKAGLRTLIWDLDPQGAASFYFRIKPKLKGPKKLIWGDRPLDEAIKATDFELLDLLPADFALRKLDTMLDEMKKPEAQLLRLLKPLAEEYDRIYLDCPPSISSVSEGIFRAASALVVPSIPTVLSMRTLLQLTQFLEKNNYESKPIWPLLSMADRRKKMHQAIIQNPPPGSFSNIIPDSSSVELMGEYRKPVLAYSRNCPAAKAYVVVWKEMETRLRRVRPVKT